MVATILWVISILSTMLAFIIYVLTDPQNVMQQAALSSIAIVYILTPYFLGRALTAINQIDSQKKKD
ncbi:TPA: hypothetical protein P5R27_000416 [Legionella pneumophila]|nr:hypothetical protein [Legionella pneumophila]HDO8005304.1 hypothetical protein [Legionella pneumophila]HDO8084695.1 hypothetical protein [Legionella pneumophila]HDO8146095.1 hypothetical protein [Legionella pneumophila]HDO8170544.1 hypothetical protein [Legionella pneumophila]